MAYAVLLSEQAKEEIATIKKSGDKPTIKKSQRCWWSFKSTLAQALVRWST